MVLHFKLAVAASSLQAAGWILLVTARPWSGWTSLFRGVFGTSSLTLSLLYFWALSHRPPAYQGFVKFNFTLLFKILGRFMVGRNYRRIQAACKSPRQHQERVLLEIITENGDTEHGKRFHLRDIRSLDDFRRNHPLTSYEHYRPYVERMMDGEENVLTKKKATSYVRTTGTTGKSKYIPYTNRLQFLMTAGSVMFEPVLENFPSIGPLQRRLYLYVHPQVTETKQGAKIETIATMPQMPDIMLGELTSPGSAYMIQTVYEANYVHLLFGLRDPDIGVLTASFLTFLQIAFEQLTHCWRDLLYDLEHGTLNADLQLPDNVRKELVRSLGNGDPERARALRKEFERGLPGIIRRVWPRLRVICAIDQTKIWPKFESAFAEGVPLMSGGYASSEGFFAMYLGPKYMDTVSYLPLPTVVVTEFIKEEDIEKSQPRTYFLDEVEVGQCYELVITQGYSGLCRYRLGDVVRISGFHDNCPYFEFVYRIGQILNLIYEKLDQAVVEDSVRAAVARWSGATLVEYVVAESTLIPDDFKGVDGFGGAPFYLFFVQIDRNGSSSSTTLISEETKMIEEEIRQRNSDFDRLRREGSISEPRIYTVRPGGFTALQKYFLANTNASAVQYKTPRKLRTFPMVEVMLENSS